MRLRTIALALASWTVATAGVAATPVVVSTTPVRNAFAPSATAVSVTFDQPLLPSSIDASSFRVFGRATGTATGPLTLSNGNQTITLSPSRPFSAGETVYVNLSHDLRAADATPFRSAGYAFQFTVSTAPATRVFTQIDSMSNRIANGQTRIYGALQADLNHDGWIDLATVNEVSGDLRVFLNKADGSGLYDAFLRPPYPVGLEASPNEPADVDHDGKMDMVVSSTDGGGVWIAHGNGDGTFGGTQSILTGSEPHGVAVLDVDGDGDMDIVDAVEGDDRLALLLNDGHGNFSAPTFFDSGCSGEWGLNQADMNGDGIFDLVAGCVVDEKVAVVLGNGDGTFTALPPQAAGGPPWQVALGDVDGDGDIDVALANSMANNGALLRNDGTGALSLPVTVPMPAHTPASDLGDLDGDGDLDWVLSSFGAGLWRVYVNDGAGNFTFDQDIPAPANPSCAVLLDFDNDGDLDMALSDEIADVVNLMQNENAPTPICPPSPGTCRAPIVPAKARLQLRTNALPKNDQLSWQWVKGPVTSLAEYGDPRATDDYAFCLYDAGALVMSATAPAGGVCRSKPCWKASPTAAPNTYTYASSIGSTSGTRSVKLKASAVAGQPAITWKGKGAALAMPDLGAIVGPVVAQVHRSGGGPCFEATYSAPFLRHDGTRFDDKAD